MKQFKTILGFELKSYLKNKVFIGVTLFLVIAIALVMFVPAALHVGEADTEEPPTNNVGSTGDGANNTTAPEDSGLPVILISCQNSDEAAMIRDSFAGAFTGYNVKIADSDDDIKAMITGGEIECAFVFDSIVSYTYYVENLSLYDDLTMTADAVLENVYRINAMTQSGMNAEDAMNILSVQIDHSTETLGKDQMQNFFYTYIMIFALYMVILLYGQMVATNVATEKSSRAMEVLITSARPTSMMFGKVIASCIAGIIQLVCIFGSAFICFNLNKSYWGDNMIVSSIFDMPIELLLYMLLFFVLGFLIYAFMYGAIGSTASKLEDINTSVMPITMLFIIAFFVVIFSMSSGNIDNIAMKICSFIPFTSPMAMFTRIAMSTVAPWEIILSVVILIGSVFGIGVLAAKIYRVGVLLYGTSPKLSSILKAIRKA